MTVQVGETDSWSFADTLTVDTNETIPNNLVIVRTSQNMVNRIVLITLVPHSYIYIYVFYVYLSLCYLYVLYLSVKINVIIMHVFI